MKTFLLFTFFLQVFSIPIYAQDYKPYKVKSGKIEYELKKYASKSHYSNINGVENYASKQVPYVAEIVNYYWDEYGDVAFEESYQVAKFGGDPISKKKISERLWHGDHRYYYDFEEDRLVDDPNHIRIECRDRFQYYQIMNSWVETIYMGAKKTDTVKILGKETALYKINTSHDIYVWKGLVLKDESFSTKKDGKRLVIEREKIATKIDTGLVFDQRMFNSSRLKKDLYFKNIDKDAINNLLDGEPNRIIQIQETGIKITEGDLIIYVTSNAHIGKFKVLEIQPNSLTIAYVTFDDYGEVLNQSSNLTINNTFSCNLDEGTTNETKMYQQDFKYNSLIKSNLFPYPTLGFYLVKKLDHH